MRQVAPWGKPVTNPGAFGAGADDETFGSRLRMPGLTPDQVRLGDPNPNTTNPAAGGDAGDSVSVTVASPWKAALVGAAGVAVGGALLGYLATGGRGWRGPYIGATANMALFFGGSAIAGRNTFSTTTTATLGVLAVASASGAGYFFMQQRRRK
jgi:hypothetical protein